MTLELKNVSKTVEGQTHIYPTDLTLEKGTMNVLLGPTLSGKTSLMHFALIRNVSFSVLSVLVSREISDRN